jgi:hypothetical protein
MERIGGEDVQSCDLCLSSLVQWWRWKMGVKRERDGINNQKKKKEI